MGYNTWNDLRCENVSSAAVRALANAMVDLGLEAAGYKYLNVDDCWSSSVSPSGELVEDAASFPEGMGSLVKYVHSKGLLFGLYGDRGWSAPPTADPRLPSLSHAPPSLSLSPAYCSS